MVLWPHVQTKCCDFCEQVSNSFVLFPTVLSSVYSDICYIIKSSLMTLGELSKMGVRESFSFKLEILFLKIVFNSQAIYGI